MIGRLIQSFLFPPTDAPPYKQRFKIVRDTGGDFYAIGVLPQFAKVPSNKPAPYHVLRCQKTKPTEAAICRGLCEDRPLVSEILEIEGNPTYRAIWASSLYGGRFTSIDSGTHWFEFEYCTRPGRCRALVRWEYDFGISPRKFSNQVALEICHSLIDDVIPDLQYQDLLIPSKHARRYWHTAIERSLLRSIGAAKVN